MKRKTQTKRSLIAGGLLIAVFAVFLIAVMLRERGRPAPELPDPVQTAPSQTAAPDLTQPTAAPVTEPSRPEREARRINFLLVGRDAHGEGENGRSDAMLLCSVDTGTGNVTLISFLRDLYLPIPGHGSNRLNAAYSWGGSELLKQTLQENFAVGIDVTLEIDFDGFVGLIDRLGGVEITLTDREAEHMGGGLAEGKNLLDGEQALAYSRIRYLDSDFGRTERQRNVLAALLEKFRSASFQEMLDVTDAFLDESTSDHSDDALLEYALELYTTLSEAKLITHRVPADGTYTYETIRGMSVIGADLEENRALLAQLLG